MSLDPILAAPLIIQVHAAGATAAFVLGGLILFRPKGDGPHRGLGKLWVALMAGVAVTSFFIWELKVFGLFSPIHLLSISVLYALWRGVGYARRRNIARHRRTMQGLYLGAVVVAGVFTFFPGRIMHEVAFGADGADAVEWVVFALVLIVLVGAIWALARVRIGRRGPQPKRAGAERQLAPGSAWR